MLVCSVHKFPFGDLQIIVCVCECVEMKETISILKLLVPSCFLIGASMELFMVKTGFYDIVTKKQAERNLESDEDKIRRRKRLAELNILKKEVK